MRSRTRCGRRSPAVGRYPRFCLSFRDVEELRAERGVTVSFELCEGSQGKL